MTYRLGKTPARAGAVKLKLGVYLDAAKLPEPPATFGHYGVGVGLNFGMLANDKWSDCVFAGAAHETMVWTHRVGSGQPVAFTDQCVLADYALVTGFDPADPSTDDGTDMVDAADFRRRTGVVDAAGNRHKIDSYLALKVGDADQLALATYLFGAVGIGINFPVAAIAEFDAGAPWDVGQDNKTDGGHYVPCIGRNSDGNFLIVTWGRLHAMTPAFYEEFNDESLAYVSTDPLKNNLSPEGFGLDDLRRDLAAITK